jgi:hypothetical protein
VSDDWDGVERRESERREEGATAGAQRQIDKMRHDFAFALKSVLAAFAVFVAITAVSWQRVDNAASDAQDAVAQAEAERAARAQSVAGALLLDCDTNNAQDQLLASLVRASLRNGKFGEDLDTSRLTAFDLTVLASIARIQAASGNASALPHVFRRKLHQLEDLTPCQREIVDRFLAGEPIPTIEQLNSQSHRSHVRGIGAIGDAVAHGAADGGR